VPGHPFIAILGNPQARRLAAGGVVGRFREGGTGLAIVLAVRAVNGSYATAGLAAAGYLAGAALSRPVHGRWADRSTTARALLVPSAANAAALIGLAVATWRDAPVAVLVALAVLVGLTLPALSAVLRSLWPRVSGELAEHAYAFDTLLYEVSLVVSPAIVGLLAVAFSPAVALIVLAVAGSAGTAMVVRTSVPPRVATDRLARAGTRLLTGTVALLVGVACFVGLAEGSLTVIVPAFASSSHRPGASGLLLSALAIGSLIGALAYGSIVRGSAWAPRLVGCTAALAASFVVLGALHPDVVVFGLVLTASGIALSPTLTTGFIALQRASPASALTEAFTWASFSASAGAAGGQALAGWLIAGPGIRTALWEPAAGAGAALVICSIALRRSRLRERVPGPSA
jgi:MFS family permease